MSMKFKTSDIFCINVKGHSEEQLFAIAKVYVIGFERLKDLKSKYERVWMVQEKVSGSVTTYLVAAAKRDKRGYLSYEYFEAGFTIEEIQKAISITKPINTPKLPGYLKSTVEKAKTQPIKIVLDVNAILDKISECGIESLTNEELEFLKKI